jgi:molecular chaperone DnaK (HSP70)
VSFLEASDRLASSKSARQKEVPSRLVPHPSHVVVGRLAKQRIDSHPHHTLYNAKRILGRPYQDAAVNILKTEVEFAVEADELHQDEVVFRVPHHQASSTSSSTTTTTTNTLLSITPQQVGSYVIHHLMDITKKFLGHDNIKSAVICVPAKFDSNQRRMTIQAFEQVGVSVARVLEEPTAAALAYGLHRKPGVDHILVYDFGGGTLDVSLLHVSDGYVDVMGSDGDDRLGGADFDAAIAHYLLDPSRHHRHLVEQTHAWLISLEQQYQKDNSQLDLEEELAMACPKLSNNDNNINTPLCTVSSFHTLGEQMKIDLSSLQDDPNATVHQECFALVVNDESDKQGLSSLQDFCDHLQLRQLSLSLNEFNSLAHPLLERSLLPIRRLMADLNLAPDDIDEVVMVGGTTRMPQIRNLVRQEFATARLNTHIDPDITVAYGAASVID